jgi:hypothetical protein
MRMNDEHRRERWPLERALFALAGTVTLISAALAAKISKWFLALTALVGINQLLYVFVGACPASIVLRRACHLRSAIYEDRAPVSEDRRGPDRRGPDRRGPDRREVAA